MADIKHIQTSLGTFELDLDKFPIFKAMWTEDPLPEVPPLSKEACARLARSCPGLTGTIDWGLVLREG